MSESTFFKSCPCPATSPWGAIQTKSELAPGIWSVSTAGHGGIKLSRERNAGVPKYMRREGGWYEEDCEWSIAAVVYPIGFQRKCPTEGSPDRTEYDIARETFRHWYPDQFEEFAGIKLKAGESRTRDEQTFRIENEGNFVVTSAWGSWAPWVPQGMVGVSAIRRSDDTRKEFLVPEAEYQARTGWFVVDLARHNETKIPETPPCGSTP